MKKSCISLREHAANIINFEKKKMLPLTEKELKLHQYSAVCYSCRILFWPNLAKNENYCKFRDHLDFTGKYRVAAHSTFNLKFIVTNKIPAVFHNGSNYDYHFIIKEIANEFKDEFKCLAKNTENYKTFSALIEKEIRKVDKDGNEDIITIYYKIKFIDSTTFMVVSLSNLVNILVEEIHKIKCKNCNYFLITKVLMIN